MIITKNNPKCRNSKKRKIVIEIDGDYHKTKEQREKDTARTRALRQSAFKVLRFTNNEVKDENMIIKKFLKFLQTIKEKELNERLNQIKSEKLAC